MLQDNDRKLLSPIFDRIISNNRGACIPVYGDIGTGELLHVGTALLIKRNNVGYILTAAHIIDEANSGTLYILIHGTLHALVGDFIRSRAPAHSPDKIDRYDFAFRPLTNKEHDGLNIDNSFIQAFPGNPLLTNNSLYLALGYPNSKNKPNNATGSLKLTPYPYINVGNESADHIFLKYEKKARLLDTGIKVNAAQLRGMSGGGIFTFNKTQQDATLSGLIIRLDNGHIVGTKMHTILRVMDEYSG